MRLEFGTLVDAPRTYCLAGLMLAAGVVLGMATGPVAAENFAPPKGSVIDLSASGGAIPSSATLYTSAPFTIDAADIVGGLVPITFAFRNDSFGLVEFWGADLFDVNEPTKNLLANANFSSSGLGLTTAPHWEYAPPSNGTGVPYASLMTGCGVGHCWVDATAGGYDELSQQVQSVVLNSHDQYQISFFVSDPNASSSWTWSQFSTNGSSGFGGNGADILAFVGPVGPPQLPPPCSADCVPIPVPEPSTWAMMLLGFSGLGFLGRRRVSTLASASRT